MAHVVEELHFYLSALEQATYAIEQARRIRPDHGLDHAVERLRSLFVEGSQQLQQYAPGEEPASPG
jgi:hypothetical protein